MSEPLSVLRSLDPYHQRIGYLAVLARVAMRGLDIPEALRSRLEDLLFERVYSDDPRMATMLARIGQERRKLLLKMREPHDDPAAILRKPETEQDWHYLSALWLCDDSMPSPLGFVGRKKLSRLIDLGKWTGILLPTLELSDRGYMLRLLLEQDANGPDGSEGRRNWLNPWPREAVAMFYLRTVLLAEAIWPFLLGEMVQREETGRPLATRGKEGLLLHAARRMHAAMGRTGDIADVMSMKDVVAFIEAIEAKESTAENYLRPRMEMAVDLGLVGRESATGPRKSRFPWKITDRTRILAEEWAHLAVPDPPLRDYLDKNFFRSMAGAFGHSLRAVAVPEEKIMWFAHAYGMAKREIGFTPGRFLAELACLLAFEKGFQLEVEDAVSAVLAAARSPLGDFMHFSGGSRFDDEFLIRLDPGLLQHLQQDRGPPGHGEETAEPRA